MIAREMRVSSILAMQEQHEEDIDSQERLQWTDIFLRAFQERLRYQVWVNPVPQERWWGTTAEEIGKLIPMVECDRAGLQQAVKVLRGKR